ncbi:hypothetical protein N7509_001768 [Penicillium cosmopolitanum]|uniref:Uncharacterized protein n=1 Tax=Penicillium cosmopolitanum TaxID=1131564 RepID=A0A9W9W7L6_9EURO|nr:uncharacterized protein N7509_001768 [Penicillium cosmopolitanum]KAJ5407885.1 hypothetical protein N7509_001768 [Penicillium cosmopolitanum]
MQSTSHQGSLPDRSRDHTVTTEANPTPSQAHESTDHSLRERNDRVAAEAEAEAESTWQPRFDRRQSWSTQDRKHQLQERLLNVEGSRERGFTEN